MTAVTEEIAEYRRQHGPLRDSRIVGSPIDVCEDGQVVGFRLQVQLARGQHAGHVESAVPLIAATYRTVPDGVRVLSVGDHSRCVVEVIQSAQVISVRHDREDRMAAVHPYTGPTLDLATGRWQTGISIKDGSPVYGTLWTPKQGMRPMWLPGDPGGGKTGALATDLLSVTGHGIISPWVIDMQDGASLGEWRDTAPRFAGDLADARELIREANAVLDARGRYLSRHALKVLEPSEETPGIVVPVDEAPELAGDSVCTNGIERIVRKGRKVCMQVWWATQMANASRGFSAGSGGSVLRGLLKSANVMLFRADGTTATTAMSGFARVDTTVIPVGVAGAHLFGGPAHPVPLLSKHLYEEDPKPQVLRAVLPDIEHATSRVEAAPTPTVALTDAEATVYAVFEDAKGPVRTGTVLKETAGPGRLGVSTVHRVLARLEDVGLIRKTGIHGEWERIK